MNYRRRKKKSAFARLASWLTVLLFLAALVTAGWYYYEVYIVFPRLNSITVGINGEPRDLLSGDHLALHPKDRVKILKISTNIPLNLYIRLVSSDFDVGALRYREWRIDRLLPGQSMFESYHLQVKIKYRNRPLGSLTLDVKPYVDDWLDKVDRTIDKKLRLSVLKKATAMFPDEARLKKRLLDEYKAQGEWKSVASMLEKTAANSADEAALKTLLKSYRATKNSDGVISVLKRFVSMTPRDLEIRIQLAEALEKKEKWKLAAREYEAALGMASGKEKLSLYEKLGYLWTKLGKNEKAIVFYQKASEMDPKDANLYYNLSYLLEKTGDKQKSRHYLEKALALKSTDIEGRMKLAQDLINIKHWEKAETLLSEVLRKKPESIEALLLMAEVLDRRGKKKELITVYRKILSVAPNNETVLYNLGALEYEAGDLKNAVPYLVRYVKRHPNDAQTHGLLLDIYRKLKNPEQAFGEALTLTKLGTKDLDTYLYATEHLSTRGEYKQLIPLVIKGLKIHPQATELRNYLVIAYLKTGQEKKAVVEMEKIMKKRTKDLGMLRNLARLKEKLGDYPGAVAAYKRIITLDPENEEAAEAYFRLRLKVMENEKSG